MLVIGRLKALLGAVLFVMFLSFEIIAYFVITLNNILQ